MKVWVFVEGEADRIALETLWESWRESLRTNGHGISVIPLDDKSRFFRKIGHRAAEKLRNNAADLVVGLPDLYPNAEYSSTCFRHDGLDDLRICQARLVRASLTEHFHMNDGQAGQALERFFPTALKHDLEMLLLAAGEELRAFLGTRDRLGGWRIPVEDQNQTRPPKRIVEELFLTKSAKKRAYRDTKDAQAVLRRVRDIRSLIHIQNNQVNCPVFKEMLDWVGEKTGVSAYN
ncbi:MAG TPA: DUF4276 family protein [Phycisphaerae bacterium]|nr:DUF4276 family protein [Phycisphaerae bacterium]